MNPPNPNQNGAGAGNSNNNSNEPPKDQKDKKEAKGAGGPSRHGRRKRKGPSAAVKIPQVFPTSKCKLRLLKLERIKDFLLMEGEAFSVPTQDITRRMQCCGDEHIGGPPCRHLFHLEDTHILFHFIMKAVSSTSPSVQGGWQGRYSHAFFDTIVCPDDLSIKRI